MARIDTLQPRSCLSSLSIALDTLWGQAEPLSVQRELIQATLAVLEGACALSHANSRGWRSTWHFLVPSLCISKQNIENRIWKYIVPSAQGQENDLYFWPQKLLEDIAQNCVGRYSVAENYLKSLTSCPSFSKKTLLSVSSHKIAWNTNTQSWELFSNFSP